MRDQLPVSEIVNHLGEERDLYFNAAVPPIVQASNFCFKDVSEMRYALQHESEIPFYTRGSNPTIDILRKKIAGLEHTEDALIFASGSAAIAAAIMNQVKSGDHVVCIQNPYSWTKKLLSNLLSQYGVTVTYVDGSTTEVFIRAIQTNTKVIFLESPNSWTYEMQDIEAVTELAKKHQITTMIDNSYASPINMNPADFGVDIILHSATKYISGHSDTVAGVLCASKEIVSGIFTSEFMTIGGIISPFNAWLLLRGLRTLEIRMQRVAESAGKIVHFLENHPAVEQVFYPHSATYKQPALANKYLKKGAGQFTILLKSQDAHKIEQFCNSLRYFLLGCSWGGHESLIFPAITLHTSENYSTSAFPINMIRFYIGLEEPALLIDDLKVALEKLE